MKLEFSEEERAIYQMVRLDIHSSSLRHSFGASQVEARSQAKFNRFLRAGTVLKVRLLFGLEYIYDKPHSFVQNYHQVLVLLLRLRQICSHPALIQEDGVALVHPNDMDESVSAGTKDELSRAMNLVSAEFVAKMKHKLKEIALRRIETEKESLDATVEEEVRHVSRDQALSFDIFDRNVRSVWTISPMPWSRLVPILSAVTASVSQQ